jgi:AraC-like DNA-binding protein/quercetin dioxygenase-like cupin family protein
VRAHSNIAVSRSVIASEANTKKVRGCVLGYPHGGRLDQHAHDWAQLTLVTESSVTIETESAYFVQPQSCALWVPARVPHEIRSRRRFRLYVLYFEPGSLDFGAQPAVIALPKLAVELVKFICSAPGDSDRRTEHHQAIELLTSLLAAQRGEPFRLPRPVDARARRLASYFLARPDDRRGVDVIAAEKGGASLRTLERIFRAECGLTIAAWRRQSRLLGAMQMLTDGASIARVATAVGFETAAAFSSAFRAAFGAPPSTFRASAGDES